MITYLIRQDSDHKFTLSKWEGGKQPVAVYVITIGQRAKCSCPSGHNRGYCKHSDMVKAWVKRGMPMEEVAS